MYRKLIFGSAILLVIGIFVGFVGFPIILQKLITSQMNLKPGSDSRQLWEKYPFPLNFKIYVFNVTNPDEVQNGGKPFVQEVGPFVFEEWKEKHDIEDIENEDAITFNMRNIYIFRPDLGLSGEEIITIPHPLVQVIALSVKKDKAAMIGLISEGLQAIFQTSSAFLQAPFMDIFFRGIDVNCSPNNSTPAVAFICLNFHSGNVNGAFPLNETHFKFGLMGTSNNTNAGHFKVSRGIQNSSDVGKVLEFGDETQMDIWNGDLCNQFRGTDSTIFAPYINPQEGLWTYSTDLCRSLQLKMQKKSQYNGIPVYHYIMDFGDIAHEPENQCYCTNYPSDCPNKGTMDLHSCNELPMIASMPHFLHGDAKLLDDIDGLNPQEFKHGIYIDFEIISGTPLSIAKRLQFNLNVQPIAELEAMKNLRTLVMPLFWIEESVNLNKTFTDVLKNKIFFVIKLNSAFKWITTIFGATGILLSGYMIYITNKDPKVIIVNAQ